MAEIGSIKEIMAKKKAGVERMQARQARVCDRVADYIEGDAESLDRAQKVVERKLGGEGRCLSLVKEWGFILENWERERIVEMFREQAVETDQLRACSPFVLPCD